MTAGCPACASPMRPFRLALERATIARCERCGHGLTVSGPRHVGADAYATTPGARAEYERAYLPGRLRSYDAGLELLGPPAGRMLLDFGSNYGDFLERAASRGWRVVGVEPGDSVRALAVARARDVTVRSLDEAIAVAPFHAVTLWDVLEHLPSPEDHLERLARLLAPGGRMLLRVPDARIFEALGSSRRWRALRQPYLTLCHPTNPEEHVSHFTPDSLATMAARAGLRERARLAAGHGERVVSGRTRADVALRRLLHRAGARLPYEFTMLLEPA
jgi:2-polyprenyl-3-methyl-5-hydroxy-6-metoxy-1,4-benzoquinol methylase